MTPSPRMRLAFSAPRRPLQDLWLRLKGCVQHELSSTSGCTEHRPSQHKSLDHFDLRRELHKVPEPSSCCKTRPLVSSLDSQEAAAATKRPAHVSHAAPVDTLASSDVAPARFSLPCEFIDALAAERFTRAALRSVRADARCHHGCRCSHFASFRPAADSAPRLRDVAPSGVTLVQ